MLARCYGGAVTDTDQGDLTVTALYTSETWRWAGFAEADLLATAQGRGVFRATNAALGAAGLLRRDLPSLRHGLAQRHALLDQVVARSGCRQVIELAAGLSRRGAALSADAGLRYVEVDLPPVVARKRELLGRTERGRGVLARPNLELVGADVAEVELSGLVAADGPVLVLAEGLLMYLDAAEQRALWERVARLVARRPGSAFAFDLVPASEQPRPGRVGRTLEGLMRRFTGGRTFERDQRSRGELSAELRGAGFEGVETLEPGALPAGWEVPHASLRTQILVWCCR